MHYPEHSPLFSKIIKKLQGQKIAILGHLRPDGDCIGSQVALCRLLNTLGSEAILVNEDPVPDNLKTFLGNTPFLQASELQPNNHLAICVDCSGKDRIGKRLEATFPEILLNIDHHLSNEAYASSNIVIREASATAEILTGLILDNALDIDSITAQALYVGIATDTGQFCFSSTQERTFEFCQKLIQKGAKPAEAARALYDNVRMPKIRLLQGFLGSLKLELGGQACIGLLTEKAYAESGAKHEDAEGFVDYPRSLEGVNIAAILEERSLGIKGSLRSKDPKFRVDLLAAHFGGGGHACASGFRVEQNFKNFYPTFIQTIQNHIASLT